MAVNHIKRFIFHRKLTDVKNIIEHYNFTVNQLNNTHILHAVAGFNRIDVCEYLIGLGIDVNQPDDDMARPLHEAVRWNYLDMCKYLLKNGALIDVTDEEGHTPLHYAAWNGRFDACDLLLKSGADPDIKNSNGYTFRDVACTKEIKSLGSGEKTKVCR